MRLFACLVACAMFASVGFTREIYEGPSYLKIDDTKGKQTPPDRPQKPALPRPYPKPVPRPRK
ncbi:hypothetical protein IWQ62_003671 [Dispira parvispora]|uniref:Uncharacterized protein n=1 Tax=Dispira parvispora TaxID=1520584 RepID=A0A9W8AQG0_9FUNG|nr:hypothetical protein IWQ62_003671 [Dispira parvispora]